LCKTFVFRVFAADFIKTNGFYEKFHEYHIRTGTEKRKTDLAGVLLTHKARRPFKNIFSRNRGRGGLFPPVVQSQPSGGLILFSLKIFV